MVLGKNYDATNGVGMVLKNNRGTKKVAYNFDHQVMAEWTSKFGSITFNQIGKEFPIGGVNEMGLAVEMLNLPSTQYEVSKAPTLSEFEWVQYMLDNFKTAADIVLHINDVSINPLYSSVHYIIADRGGRSFIIEFLNGKPHIHPTTSEEYIALTNSLYTKSLDYYEKNKNNINQTSRSSLDRYSQLLKAGANPDNRYVGTMFDVMKKSSQANDSQETQWTIIYDLDNQTLYYRTKEEESIKKIQIKTLNFRANSRIYYRDIHAKSQDWQIFNKKVNLDYLSKSLNAIQMNHTNFNQHMMNPELTSKDDVYTKYQKDLTLSFLVNNQGGYIFYSLFEGEENFNQLKPNKEGIIAANEDTVTLTLYSIKHSDYVLSSFHDLNGNNIQDKRFLGLCKEPVAYSKVKPSLFNKVKYKDAQFNSKEERVLPIEIK